MAGCLSKGTTRRVLAEVGRLQSDPGASEFLAMLATLLRSAEFHRAPQALADRVCTMVEAVAELSSLREEVFSEVTEVNCQDDAALCFSNLEVRMLVWQAQQSADHHADGLLHWEGSCGAWIRLTT